jgi:hypothetical protein
MPDGLSIGHFAFSRDVLLEHGAAERRMP